MPIPALEMRSSPSAEPAGRRETPACRQTSPRSALPRLSGGDHRISCACERTLSERCKSAPYVHVQYEVDCNCVAARRGGEQRKANNQSAGDELDLAGTCDELASVGRSPEQQLMPPPGALGRTGPTGHLRMGPLLQACRADQDVDRKATTRRVQVVRGGMVGRRCDPALRDRESCPKQRRDYPAGQQSEPP